jgi:hypothetical protein
MSEAGKEPVVNKPAEDTPLVGKGDEPAADSSGVEQTKTLSAMFALVAIAVSKTQLTALLFSDNKYPIAYSFYSCVVTMFMLVPVFVCVRSQWGVPVKGMFIKASPAGWYDYCGPLTLIVLFTSLDLGFTNIAISEMSVALVQCILATNPFWCILIETLVRGKFQHFIIYLAVSGVVLGAILTSVSQVKPPSFVGLVCSFAAVLSSATKYVFTHGALRDFKGVLGPLSMLFWVDLLMCPFYIGWVLARKGEIDFFTVSMPAMSPGTFVYCTIVAGLGGLRALTQYVVLLYVTATSMSTANIFTQILNILISMMWQHVDVTPMLVIGIVVVFLFVSIYTHLKTNKNACGGIMLPNEPAPAAAALSAP